MSFSITLYRNSAEPNRVDKRNYLTEVQTISGVLREETSILAPIITLELSSRPNANYCYIPQFGRYYYITDIVSIRNNLWSISLYVDVLMSNREAILNCKGFVERNEFKHNNMLIDKKRIIEEGVDITVVELSNKIFLTNDYECIINGYKIEAVPLAE